MLIIRISNSFQRLYKIWTINETYDSGNRYKIGGYSGDDDGESESLSQAKRTRFSDLKHKYRLDVKTIILRYP